MEQAFTWQGLRLEWLTVAWCIIEAAVPIWSGIASRSIALIGFGLDSVIEIFAALVVIWQLQGLSEEKKKRALQMIAVTFFLLAAYVFAQSVRELVMGVEAEVSLPGIIVTAAALIIMPLLAWAKRRVGHQLGNPVLLAEAAESTLCALFAATTLVGLILNAAVGWWWADPVAAIVIGILAVKEGREAWHAAI